MLSNENTTEFSALAASSYSNNTTINTSSEKIDDFTLMIYIIGSDLETKSYEATKDINEMIKGNLTRPNINLILQTGGAPEKTDEIRKIDFSKVQRHQIYDHKINTLDNLGSVNMGDVTTLSNFINWTVTNYPAKKYGLILWDHGAGIKGFGKDTNFEGDAIHLTEFISLQNLPIEVSNFEKFEFIGFDSCLMATAEISHILRSISNFLVSSQEIEPDWGWNYTDIINSISSNSNTTGDFIGKQIIKSYIKDSQRISKEKEYHADRDITLSVIDLKRIPAFDKKMDELIQDAIKELKNQNSHFKVMQTVDLTESFGKTAESSIGVIDLSDFLNNLSKPILPNSAK